ncbi:hypothetical protein SAMN04489712_10964 [Thermomonospora echinospora]|uniref:Uncharacterized protein n=1 Tax=Thermomonospora echinospora TaxID=1992 RepID=A0A1H6C8G3_9ACTN|nr:hypothetical protein [Thermomonospora echinospora]SEG69241.1 hypothetical protein SAMN04489712_10964 [Thermomonospora echinospora]
MRFWKRAAKRQVHPLHMGLVGRKQLSVSLRPAEWAELIDSLAWQDAKRRSAWAPPEEARELLMPIVRAVLEDVPPDGTLQVTTDLRGLAPQDKAGPRRTLPAPPAVERTEWYVTDPWLRLRADLRDGSVLDLSVTDHVRHRRTEKRSRSGRLKIKVKTKGVARVSATRTLPRGAAVRRPATPPPPFVSVRVREGERTVIRTDAKLAVDAQVRPTPERILDVLTELFRWTPPKAARRTS